MLIALKLAAVFIVALCVVTGQALLSVLSRAVTWPLNAENLLKISVFNPLFYGCAALYVTGFLLYAFLLRSISLAQANVTFLLMMIVLTAVYTYVLGDTLSFAQWAGVVLAVCGVVAMNSGF